MSFRQGVPIVQQFVALVEHGVSDGQIDCSGSLRRAAPFHVERPPAWTAGVRTVVDQEGNAERAFGLVEMLAELGARQIGREINMSRLHFLSCYAADERHELLVEETGQHLV